MLSPTTSPTGRAGVQPGGAGPAQMGIQAERRSRSPGPQLKQLRPKNMQSRERGKPGLLGSPSWGDSLLPRGQGSPKGQQSEPMSQSTGPALESPCSHTSHSGAGDPSSRGPISQNSPFPRAARDLDPQVQGFQCFGRFRNLDRTSVCRTQNRQAHIGTDRRTEWQAQAAMRKE